MSDNAQEPTMEEILASIRRIISEDDAPASEEAKPGDPAPEPAAAAPEPETAPEPEPEAPAEEVLELTERVEAESHGDLDVFTPPAPEPEPVAAAPEPPPLPPQPEPEPFPLSATETGLVGAAAAGAAASAFGQLSAAIAMPADGRTLEDVTRELLTPLLKQWLDENLPRIVDAAVRDEVERISRARVR